MTETHSLAVNVAGDRTIDRMLAKPAVAVIPARSGVYDGFCDDSLTEYANPSIFRPPSVRQACLSSTLSVVLHRHHGPFYLGLVLYDTRDEDEELSVWVGSRQVGTVRADWNDNRRHLFVIPERIHFRGAELIRFITAPTSGPYRVESIVLLPELPEATTPELDIREPYLAVEPAANGTATATITWITNRPTTGEVQVRHDTTLLATRSEVVPLVNHEVVIPNLPADAAPTATIIATAAPGTGLPEGARVTARVSRSTPIRHGQTDQTPERIPVTLAAAVNTPLAALEQISAWPVTWGIPFAEGAVPSAENIRVLRVAPNGREEEIPAQVRPQVSWEDGSVRWVLLDFSAPLTGSPSLAEPLAAFAVEAGATVRRASFPSLAALQVEESDRAIVVTTGPLRIEVPKDHFVVPGRLFARSARTDAYEPVAGDSAESGAVLIDADGTTYRGVVDAVAVEEAGSERVVVRIDAHHESSDGRSLFRTVSRVIAYRGQPFVRLLHTFENDNLAEAFTTIRSMALRLGLSAGEQPTARLGEQPIQLAESATPASVFQETDTTYYTVGLGTDGEAVVGRASGSVVVEAADGHGLLARVRDFWQNYPKAVAVGRDTLEIGLCPPLRPDSFPVGHPDEDRLYYYLLNGVYRLKQGVSRSHEIIFAVYGNPEERVVAEAAVELAEAPPLVRVPSEIYGRSGLYGEVAARDEARIGDYERWVEAALQFVQVDRETNHDYGMLNFGDWYGERRYNWGNLEYDTPLAFLTEYLRGGDSRFYRLAEQAARHLADVDTCHHAADPLRRGGQYLHCLGHVGDYYPRGYREAAIANGRMEHSHTWVEGLYLLSLLTGDRQLWESAESTARRIAGPGLNDFDFKNCRDCGWPLIHVMGGYQATGDRYYLNAGRVIVERVLEKQRASGGWERLMVPGHCYCDPPRHMGEAGFMVGILLDGLKRFHLATSDQRVAEAIVAAGGFLIRDMWVPELSCFRYTSCPRSAPSPEQNMQLLEGICYAYRLSRDEGIRSVALIATRSVIGQIPLKFSHEIGIRILLRAAMQTLLGQSLVEPPRGFVKEITAWMRSAPHILYDVCQMVDGEIRAETVDIDA